MLLLSIVHAAETSPSDSQPTALTGNPLLQESSLVLHYPLFDKIKDSDYEPAFAKGMTDQLKEAETISSNPRPPTFENTVIALERSGALLGRVNQIFFNLASANTNPALQKVENDMAPKLAAHADAIHLNAPLFHRIETLYENREKLGLDPQSKWLIERYYKDFVRAGAKLSDADKAKLKAVNTESAALETKFAQNVLKEKNADSVVVEGRSELEGLSPNEIDAASVAAKEDKKEGKFVLPLQNTTGQPELAELKNRALRERIMKMSLARGSHGGEWDNRSVVLRLVKLRADHANLLGFANYAAFKLDDETAHDVGTINKWLADLTPAGVANARREASDMQKLIDQEQGGFQLASWDWDSYAEKVRKARYSFDESQIKPYFELNHVLFDGVFYAAHELYGITVKERHDLPVYQADVRVFDVFDADGKQLAIFIGDYYARPSKRGGAWMSEYVSQSDLLNMKPVVANHLNIPKPEAGQPTLLTFDEVTTAFHEFGHGLHGMFSNVKYPRFSGTNVLQDFVEYPSQANEMWASWPEVLKHYAKHYKTGEAMPQELFDKVLEAQKFNQGFNMTEYMAATLLDQAWHQLSPTEIPNDVLKFEADALHKAGVDFAPVPPRYRTTYFSHAFGEYSAGYYSYVWSEELAADTVEWFKANGGMNRKNGQRFRDTLLSRGGSEDAMKIFRDFSGHGPELEPLLKRRGLNEISAPSTGEAEPPSG
ncbi:MAG: M3 family metallopeptidase [Chthoniobacterales bacterium]|nr:M3 family metallopeptidase [Chthoniobacterales bacterium]